MQFYMVLADGETYTTVQGCRIVGIPDSLPASTDLDALVKSGDDPLVMVAEFGLNTANEPAITKSAVVPAKKATAKKTRAKKAS